MTCSPDVPPATTAINVPSSPESSAALTRFVADGLIATLESYRAGRLPAHRFAWELTHRTDTLAQLHPDSRVVAQLRRLHRGMDNPRTELTADSGCARRGVTASTEEQNCLSVTLISLRACSATATRTARASPLATGRWPQPTHNHNHTRR
jgi:hypothetical protein